MKESKKEIYKKYNHKELPKITNHFLHGYRCFAKLFCYAYFGVGSVILAVFVFPWLRIGVHSDEEFQIKARKFVSKTFRSFINIMQGIRVCSLVVKESEKFNNLHGKVLVANHPSILDFVFIMSLVPNANCIVRGNLTKTPLAGVIKQCYIVNTLDFNELCELCKATIDKGNNVIIFPEGTRTPRHGKNPLKKGAARIAYYSKCGVQPILVGGNDKYGLGKYDPFWSYNHTEKFIYDFSLLEEIKIDEYIDMSETLAAKRITEKIDEILSRAISENGKHYVTNRVD